MLGAGRKLFSCLTSLGLPPRRHILLFARIRDHCDWAIRKVDIAFELDLLLPLHWGTQVPLGCRCQRILDHLVVSVDAPSIFSVPDRAVPVVDTGPARCPQVVPCFHLRPSVRLSGPHGSRRRLLPSQTVTSSALVLVLLSQSPDTGFSCLFRPRRSCSG